MGTTTPRRGLQMTDELSPHGIYEYTRNDDVIVSEGQNRLVYSNLDEFQMDEPKKDDSIQTNSKWTILVNSRLDDFQTDSKSVIF